MLKICNSFQNSRNFRNLNKHGWGWSTPTLNEFKIKGSEIFQCPKMRVTQNSDSKTQGYVVKFLGIFEPSLPLRGHLANLPPPQLSTWFMDVPLGIQNVSLKHHNFRDQTTITYYLGHFFCKKGVY